MEKLEIEVYFFSLGRFVPWDVLSVHLPMYLQSWACDNFLTHRDKRQCIKVSL